MITAEPAHPPAIEALVATEGGPLWFYGNLVKIRLRGADTGQTLSLVELVGAPGDSPPLHVHRDEDEGFYVLEGELTLHVGDRELRCPAGSCRWAPRGVPHVYVVTSDRPARWLALTTPGGFDRFVAAASRPASAPTLPPPPDQPPDFAAAASLAANYGIELLGPPGMLPRELDG